MSVLATTLSRKGTQTLPHSIAKKNGDILPPAIVLSPNLKKTKSRRHLSNVEHEVRHISYSKLEKLKSTSHSSKTLPYPEVEYMLTVHIESNWGHQSMITCSEMDILGPDRIPLPNVTVSTDCGLTQSPILGNLCNRQLIKTSFDEQWHHSWDFYTMPPYIVNFSFTSSTPPEYIRIWNSRLEPTANIKKVSVYLQGTFVLTSEIPMDFGMVIPIHSSHIPIVPSIDDIFMKKSKLVLNPSQDSFGYIPVYSVSMITIEILDSYLKDSNFVGLNSIELYGVEGKLVNDSEIEAISVTRAKSHSSPYTLLKSDKKTMTYHDMWVAEKESAFDRPKIHIKLKEQTKIIMMRMWNFNHGDKNQNFGVRRMKIFFNDRKCVFNGVLKRGKGMTSRLLESVTDVWISDPEKWRGCDSIVNIRSSRE